MPRRQVYGVARAMECFSAGLSKRAIADADAGLAERLIPRLPVIFRLPLFFATGSERYAKAMKSEKSKTHRQIDLPCSSAGEGKSIHGLTRSWKQGGAERRRRGNSAVQWRERRECR